MMKIRVNALALVLLALIFFSFIYPKSEWLIERPAYSLSYDGQHKQARWVYERLTKKVVNGDSERTNLNFVEDTLIPPQLRSTNKDYEHSGFDRGHLCPAADARSSNKAMQKTFFLSNISPQVPQFNRGYWLKLEKHVRSLTKQYKVIHVYSGPLYMAHEEKDGKRYVKYQVIGPNDTAVPSHFFKVLFAEKKDGTFDEKAYILPNLQIDKEQPLESFETSIEKVVKSSGVIFSH